MNDLAHWLVDAGLVTLQQIEEAQQLQRETGVPLSMALLELEIVEERAVVDLLCAKLGFPAAPRRLHRLTIPSKLLSLIPQDFCWQYGVFPFGIDPATRKVQIAIGDPSDPEAIAALRKLVRYETTLYVAGPRQLEKAIRKHYLDSWIDETNAPSHRYFGYENITNPGAPVAQRSRSGPHQAVPNAGAAAARPGTGPHLPEAAAAPSLPAGVLARDPPSLPATPAAAAPDGAEDLVLAFDDLPVAKESGAFSAPMTLTPDSTDLPVIKPAAAPAAGLRALGRITGPSESPNATTSAELAARVDVLERVVVKLLTVMARSSAEAATLAAELRQRPGNS